MKLAKIQITAWDKPKYYNCGDNLLKRGEKAIIRAESGLEIGTVLETKEVVDDELAPYLGLNQSAASLNGEGNGGPAPEAAPETFVLPMVTRRADVSDWERIPGDENRKKDLADCKFLIKKHNLDMKLVDLHYNFEGSRLTFAFIADGRVDFRDLVKDMTRHFNRSIRLQQIGIRDEAKITGDCGHCGRRLCCQTHLFELQSITSEMAELQQCAHRGSDRISGLCGRLMCCLNYEQKGYEDLAKNLPPLGAHVKVEGRKGLVIGYHPLRGTVDVELAPENGENPAKVEVEAKKIKI